MSDEPEEVAKDPTETEPADKSEPKSKVKTGGKKGPRKKRSASSSTRAKQGKGNKRSASTKAKPQTEEETRWERTKANMRTIGGAVALAIFIRIVLFEAFEIEGPSMEPTLLNGDRVVVAKFSYGLFLPFATEAVHTWSTPKAGEVVIVKSPHDNIDIVKRVVGVSGDVIEIRDDIVIRNGREIEHRDLGDCDADMGQEVHPGCIWVEETIEGRTHRTSRDLTSPPSNHPPVTVPDGYVYILGDHRDRSNDSRYFGVVPVSRVKGRAMVIYWSHDGPSIFHNPSEWASAIRGERLFDSVQ